MATKNDIGNLVRNMTIKPTATLATTKPEVMIVTIGNFVTLLTNVTMMPFIT